MLIIPLIFVVVVSLPVMIDVSFSSASLNHADKVAHSETSGNNWNLGEAY
jgi:hypothetical protein